jgi:16S rRNA (adenine1518-N6/adenine1519-N6)-dimethyltransferase
VRARKRFGQHFLHDPGILKRLVEAIAPARGDVMVEIGPGEGALTRPLLERLEHLTVIEIDRDLAGRLSLEFAPGRLTVVAADVLEHDFSAFPAGLRIVGNLPYNISTPILFRLAEHATHFRDLHCMLQLEVVKRMVAQPSTPDYGRLSVMLQARFRMQMLFRVAAGAFRPPPKVESAVVRMLPLAEPLDRDVVGFADLVRTAFSARRKTLRNALGMTEASLAALGIDPGLRPENLSPQDYARIARRTISHRG